MILKIISQELSLSTLFTNYETSWIDGDANSCNYQFCRSPQDDSQLKHIVSQAADNKSHLTIHDEKIFTNTKDSILI